ncbi:DUF4124 domain-containing protein [Panacagrimonas sp.]|uniref:DUF4124 domain-containing protein n=1 Tax=Panacagrimonas sp. TaxID=2480088 RepID=UPI003B52D557
MRAALVLLALSLIAGNAYADKIYRWVGADNKVYFGDTPPLGARDVQPFGRKVGTSIAGSQSEAAPEQALTEAQVADCARKRAQLGTYRNAARLVERDSLGREREYSEEEKAQLIELTETELATQCGDVELAEEAIP